MQVCSVVAGKIAPSASLIPFNPSVTAIKMSWQPRFQIREDLHPEFAPSVCSIEMPRMSRLPSGSTGNAR